VLESTRTFRALGSDCSLRVWAEDDASGSLMVDDAVHLLDGLDRKWSRFRPDSELSELNRGAGKPVAVSSETCALVLLAIEAWRSTDGLFDPTVLGALVAAGYDRTFDEIGTTEQSGRLDQDSFRPSPGPGGVVVDEENLMVTLPDNVSLDFGGIGKGRCADLVLECLLAGGAIGACVDLGGDVRVGGSSPQGEGWVIAVDDPFKPGGDLALITLSSGAVTTSSRLRRQWSTADGPAHHLLDPTTGHPAMSGLAAVTVVAADAAWGEVHAKAALIAGPFDGVFLLAQAGLSGLLVQDDGTVLTAGSIDDYLLNSSSVSL
jgi:thiamine biosynthesis lipoprotein